MATSVRPRRAHTAITHIIHTRVRPTATMARNGSWAVPSSVRARGITAITGMATVITDAESMATTVAATMDRALMHTTEVVDLVTGGAMREVQWAEASTVEDDADRVKLVA